MKSLVCRRRGTPTYALRNVHHLLRRWCEKAASGRQGVRRHPTVLVWGAPRTLKAPAAMMNEAQQLGKAVVKPAVGCDGYNLFLAEGGAADQGTGVVLASHRP